jgi:uncharacterized transporter YbjL
MIKRVFNAPIALLFLIIGMSYLLGKQKIRGFEPGIGIWCAAHGCQVTGSIASGAAPECRQGGSQESDANDRVTRGAYAFANVLLTIAISLILLLWGWKRCLWFYWCC